MIDVHVCLSVCLSVCQEEGVSGGPYYAFDYVVESTRGYNHYVARAAVAAQRLYVLTVQIKEKDYPTQKDAIAAIAHSFLIKPPSKS